tara:strand:+ start:1164 stop:2324 length:1161 start_codon:yes stop_codon:yes gene_type:complete
MGKRIVHVVDYLMPTLGYQEFLLPKWNAKFDHEVSIVTSDRYYPIPNYDDTWGKTLGSRICGSGQEELEKVKIIRLPVLFEFKARPLIKNLIETIQSLDPDLVFIHGTGSFSIYQCSLAFRNSKTKVFADNHMIKEVVQEGFLQSIYYVLHKFLIKNLISKYVDYFIGTSPSSCKYMEDCEGVPVSKMSILDIGIDTTIFKPGNEKKENLIPIIVQSGKLTEEKKPQWLSEAVLKLLDKGVQLKLKFIGSYSPEIMTSIQDRFSKKGYEEMLIVSDLLPLEQLASEFRKSDLVVFPEAASLSCLEAAACNTMVIMADLPASMERVARGVGKVYRRGDIEHLAETIFELLENKDTLKRLGESSGKSARKEYSYESITKQLFELAGFN